MGSRFKGIVGRLGVLAVALGVWACVTPTHAAEIKVLSAGAMKGMVTDLAETFRQETGHTVVISSGTAGEIRQKVTAGDPADVVFVTDTVLEQLAATSMVVADAVKDKTVLWQGGYAAEALVKGQADLCVHQISEILPVKGVTLVGPLPRELQKITTYSAALSSRAATPDVARAFIAFVARPSFKAKFAAAGFD